MQTRSQSSQTKLQQLQESVSSLMAKVQESRRTMDVRHESTVAAILELQLQFASSLQLPAIATSSTPIPIPSVAAQPRRQPPPGPSPLPAPPPRLALPLAPGCPPLPIRRLSPAEMQVWRAKGLCFNYDEGFFTGHRCKPKQFLLLLVDDDPPDIAPDPLRSSVLEYSELPPDSSPPHPATILSPHSLSDVSHFHLSVEALSDSLSPCTLRLLASILGPVKVLVDSGSSHNILQPRLPHFLQLAVQALPTFSIFVGNGASIPCSGLCPAVPIAIQQQSFCIPFYLLPIHGADVVLGVEWLQTLGPFV
ncbi:UNVERIFIED_CONTAM: hypothetical protein Slati_2191300 [Sesamum latifolium]|uniref:Uncharacterized protein n=1 Tax=Sesamum latifolium TaxID=2727402 RepID=A0AAW2WXL1_9LAMI